MKKYFQYIFILVICFYTTTICAENNEGHSLVNKLINEDSLTNEELSQILSTYDFYDCIRTNTQIKTEVEAILKQSINNHYYKGITKSQVILGAMLRDEAKYFEAIKTHQSSLRISEKTNDTLMYILSLNNLSVTYRRLDKLRLALDFAMDALNSIEEYEGNPETKKRCKCVALNSIGNINISLNQPYKAIDYFRQSYKMEKDFENHLGMAVNMHNMGYAYQMIDSLDKALIYYRQSLNHNNIINLSKGKSICNNSIGDVLMEKNMPKEALQYYLLANLYDKDNKDIYFNAQSHANIGKAYLVLEDYDKAFSEYSITMDIAKQTKTNFLFQLSHNLFSDYYEKLGNYKKAHYHLNLAKTYQDSLINERNVRYINEIIALYETEQKQQQLNLIKLNEKFFRERLDRNRKFSFFMVISIGVILIFLIVLIFQNRKLKKSYKKLIKKNIELVNCDASNNGINKESKKELIDKIQNEVINKKRYCENNFSLEECSKLLGTNRSYLSDTINDFYGTNYNNFINELRVKEAIRIMTNENNKNLYIENIIEMIGFNAKSTFNNAFKKFTGVTPSHFIKK